MAKCFPWEDLSEAQRFKLWRQGSDRVPEEYKELQKNKEHKSWRYNRDPETGQPIKKKHGSPESTNLLRRKPLVVIEKTITVKEKKYEVKITRKLHLNREIIREEQQRRKKANQNACAAHIQPVNGR